MKIYIAHSKDFDYKNELYLPIRNDKELKKLEIILPHEISNISSNTRDFYRSIDLFIAECSYPAVGMGIELGWVSDDNIPIYCIHKKGIRTSNSIKAVTSNIYEYNDKNDMLNIIKRIINKEIEKR